MSNPATGGPAFPVHFESHNRTNGQLDGMTLRDFFIAHAPAEPQHWFAPTMPHRRPVAPVMPALETEEDRDDWRGHMDGFLNPENIRSPQLAAHARALIFHRTQARDWDIDCQRELLLQWPGAWADEQIRRRASEGTEPQALPAAQPFTPAHLESAGYRIHRGTGILRGRYWWTFTKDGMLSVDTPQDDWATIDGAIMSAEHDLMRDLLQRVEQVIDMSSVDNAPPKYDAEEVIGALRELESEVVCVINREAPAA